MNKSLIIMLTLMVGFMGGIWLVTDDSDESYALTDGDWTYTVTDGVATLTKFNGTGTTGLTIPDTVTDGSNTYPVVSIMGASSSNPAVSNSSLAPGCGLYLSTSLRSIGDYAFTGCNNFTGSIVIPDTGSTIDTILSIGTSAFEGCSGFNGSLSLSNVREIGDSAFKNCSGLTGNLTLPNSVTSIGDNAFDGCSRFDGTLTVSFALSSIPNYAFHGCSGFTALNLPSSSAIASIGNYAFSGCSGFSGSLTIPSSVRSIGYWAFENCTGFTGTLTLPVLLNTIQSGAFEGCSGFTGTLALPSSLTSIPQDAFSGCSGFIGLLSIPNGVTTIGANAFSNCSGFTSILFPDELTTIDAYAFSNCSGLLELYLPDSLTTLGLGAFSNCSRLTGNIEIPYQITSIGSTTFWSCSSITSITLNENLSSIGSQAFYGCTSLITIYDACPLTFTQGSTGDGFIAYYVNDIYECHTVTVVVDSNQTGWGTVSDSRIIAIDGYSLTTSQYGETISSSVPNQSSTANADRDYEFVRWDNISGNITADRTITAVFRQVVFTVSFVPNEADWGSINPISVKASEGTSVYVSSNVVTIDNTDITATPSDPTVAYVYSFGSWSNVPNTITADTIITANFVRTPNVCVVTIQVNDPSYGSVDVQSLTVDYGSAISVNGNELTIGVDSVTATPTSSDAQYTYSFSRWVPSTGTVTQAMTIRADFLRQVNNYLVHISVNEIGWGTVSQQVLPVPYGTIPTVSGMTLEFGNQSVTASISPTTLQYTYGWDGWTDVPASVTEESFVTANFSRDITKHSVTFRVNDATYGSTSLEYIRVDYGTTFTTSDNELYIDGQTITATPHTDTSRWHYEFTSWSPTSGTVLAPTTIDVTFTRTIREYLVTIIPNNVSYGDVDIHTMNVPYGTTYTTNDNVLTLGSTPITATPSSPTAEYIYDFSEWSSVSGTVTGPTAITAIFIQALHQYTVYINSNDNSWGTVDTDSLEVAYGTVFTSSGDTLTLDGVQIFASPTNSTAKYTYAFEEWSPSSGTVSGPLTITANFSRTVNEYEVAVLSNNTDYGTVSVSSVTVPYGSSIVTEGSIVHIGDYTVSATVNPASAEYMYGFTDWTCTTYEVTGANESVTANFTRNIRSYSVYFTTTNPGWGDVSSTPIVVEYGTQLIVNGNTLSLAGNTIVATPTADTEQYDYAFAYWSMNDGPSIGDGSQTIVGETIMYAHFTRTSLISCTVLFDSSNSDWGTVSPNSVTVPIGSTITVNGNVLSIDEQTITATPTQSTAQYTYSFDEWVTSSDTVTQDMTITANFSRSLSRYTVTFTMDSGSGSWTYPTIEVDYGSTISSLNNVVLLNGVSNTFTTSAVSDTESYSFKGLTGIPTDGIIVEDITVHAETDVTFSIPAIFIIQPKMGDDDNADMVWNLFKLLPIIILVVIIMFGATAFFKSREDE